MDRVRKFKSHPESTPGDSCVIGGECISCGAPHAVAPDLIGWAAHSVQHCIWKKQPGTASEPVQAFDAFGASCTACYRYASTDPAIIDRIGSEFCDNAPLPAQPSRGSADAKGDFRFALTASTPSRLSAVAQAIAQRIRLLFGRER